MNEQIGKNELLAEVDKDKQPIIFLKSTPSLFLKSI